MSDPPTSGEPTGASGSGGVTVRPGRAEDRDAALRLWALLLAAQGDVDPAFAPGPDAAERWATEYADLLRDAGSCVVVAEAPGGAVVGLAAAHLAEAAPIFAERLVAFVDAVVVATAWRRRGVARRLVAAVEAWARQADAAAVEARVVARNAGARAFWARQGADEAAVTVRLPLRGDEA